MKEYSKKQMALKYAQEKKAEVQDDFAKSIKPLAELLDSLRHLESFPIGKDEDILALSNPPYYTACPNPYIKDFIERYGKPYDPERDDYHRTPFVGDISEGKNDPIYNAHSYHTKVPHKAIMKFIEHYTEEGDIVFDGFCGSGMTGVAAQLLNRRAVLVDLSPAATFISYNYNTPVDVGEFEKEANRILDEVEKECGWMYETLHTDGKTKGRINYTVWSDVFICPYCHNEYVFWHAAVDKEKGKVLKEFSCPECRAEITKTQCERAKVTFYDQAIGQEITQAIQVPVLINYSVGKKRFEKEPDKFDLDLIRKIERSTIPYWFPTSVLPVGYNTEQPRRSHGVTHVHHFYTKRNLWVLAACMSKPHPSSNLRLKNFLLFLVEQLILGMSRLARYVPRHYSQVNRYLSGTLYIASQVVEVSPWYVLNRNKINKIKNLSRVLLKDYIGACTTFCSSADSTLIRDACVDYIFTDPPFGNNLMYSELNFLWEAWLKVFTNNQKEAIVNNVQNKGLNEYKELMTACFREMFRILKPNRWMTVVFHNSKASVWNAIQDAITKAGFVIAQVTVMDKQQGSFKQVTSAGAVKNDLIINAYKPKQEFTDRFLKNAGQGMEKEFLAEHLTKLPVEPNIERTEQMLYSKLLAQYVQRGYAVRFSARQFHKLLAEHFKSVDGYWFTEEQLPRYEEWKRASGLKSIKEIKTGQQVFITDEKTALTWLYQFLDEPKSYSDIYTAYHKAVTHLEDEIPELRDLLDNNFILEDKLYRRPRTKEEEERMEAQRERELERAFDRLLAEVQSSSRRLKNVRKEALKYGFTRAYQEQRFADIMAVAIRLDRKILEENSEINDFVEIAEIKMGEDI